MKRTRRNLLNFLRVFASVLFALTVSIGAYAQQNGPGTKTRSAKVQSVTSLIQRRQSVFSGNRSRWIGQPLGQIAKPASPGCCVGWFDGISSEGVTGGAKVFGWAWSKSEKKAPSQILLVDDIDNIVGLASGGVERPDVLAALPEAKGKPGWKGYSKFGTAVSAYALVDGGKKACQLSGKFDIVAIP